MNNHQKKWFDSAAIKEDESKTTKNSKHLVLNNGTRRSIFTSSSINYYDKSDHKWKEIDNTLQETNDGYQAQLGNYTAKFLRECDKETVEVKNGANVISWKYLGTEKNPSAVSAKNRTTKEFDRRKSKLAVKSAEHGMYNPFPTSRAVYENAEGNINLDYHIEGDGIKENITVKEKAELYKYYFSLRVNGFEMKQSSDGRDIEFYRENADTTAPEFVMPAPFMYDSNGNRSDDVQYDMEVVGDGEYILAIEANPEWINDTERVFPVYIDPQLLKINKPYITLSHERYQLCECESTACNESEWVYVSSPYYNYINVSNNEMEKTNAILRIKKSEINLTRGDLVSAKLVFPPYSGESYADTVIFKMNDKYFAHETGLFEVDITSFYNNSSDDFNIEMTMATEGASRKYSMPILQVEYKPKTLFPVKKSFEVEDGVTAEFDILSGNATVNVEDITDPILGINVVHVYKPNDEFKEYGQNFRLNLDEKLVKTSTSSIGAQYAYTDAQGDVHTFNEHFYRIGLNGEKEYIESNISEITADTNGRLWLDDREVFRELTTDRGLRASARLTNNVNNANWVEQRLDEERQIDEQIKSYRNTLCNFVSVNKETGASIKQMTFNNLKSPDEVDTYITEIECNSNLLLPKEEALSYKSLLTQKESLNVSRNSLVLQKSSLTDSANSLLLQIKSTESTAYQISANNAQLTSLDIEYDSLENAINKTDEESDRDIIVRQMNHISTQRNLLTSNSTLINEQADNLAEQKDHMRSQIRNFPISGAPTGSNGTLTRQYNNVQDQIDVIDDQLNDIKKQIALYESKSTKYIPQFKSYYKEYLNLNNQFDKLKTQAPVAYLISDNAIKGFNSKGELVVAQDKYGKYIAFEREKYNTDGKTRISSVYDEDGNTIHFSYNGNNQLSEICNSLGERATFRYNGFGDLVAIDRDNMPTLELSYISVGGINRIQNVASSNKTSTAISYTPIGMLKGITQNTAVIGITHDAIATGESTTLSTMNVDYTSTETTLTYDDIRKEIYRINQADEQVDEYYELVSDKVTGAEQYVYDNYLLVQTKRADKSCLNRYSYEEFNDHMEIESVENITYNSFKEPTKVVNSKYAAPRTDVDLPLEQSETEYIYNDDRKLIEKKTTYVYYNCCEAADTTVSIEKYYYDNAGELVRKESYTEGEELKTGINIEEHVFNHKGVEIQSFTYNSLDPSSKFYTENEVDDKGRVLAAFDESGEHRTVFDYERDGVTVKTERLPNGSKFSYGRDKEGTVAAITHSTENGEENSTTQMRTLDVVTEIKSGNNTVQYTYDGKRRVNSVSLNGVDDYVTYTYSGEHTDAETVTATMSDGTVAETIKDMHGNVSESSVGNKKVKYHYNNDQLPYMITEEIDNSTTSKTDIGYNDKGSVEHVKVNDVETERYVYDDKNVLTSKTVDGTTYTFTHKVTADRSLDSISVDGKVVRPVTDVLGRNTGKTIEVGENKIAEEKISYVKFGDHATNLPSTIRFATYGVFNESIQYKYDALGNITEVFENGRSACRYEYDALGRLTREDNVVFGKTTTWAYDNNGNITARYEYGVTAKPTSELYLLNCICKRYTYADNSDQLMSYDGVTFEYDLIGNPTTYCGKTAVWEYGRQLKSYDGNTFSYDARGRRTAKNGITFTYDSNGNLIKQSNGLEFLYDHTGVFAVKYAGSTYFYRKDAQANIVALLDNSGVVVVKYKYDAWGKCQTTVVDSTATEIASLNPFRYRSYYLDTETGFYFLKTRYYDPEIGRFMTIDDISYLDPDSINGLNLYAYCGNNPVNRVDSEGNFAISTILIGCLIAFAVGATVSTVSQGLQYGWNNISVGQVLVDGLFAAASVALAATGISFIASVGIGAAMGLGQYAIDSAFHGEAMTWQGAIIAAVMGGVGGAFSGAGAKNLKNISKIYDGMTGRAAQGVKALVTTAQKYGLGSKQITLVNNLYGKAIKEVVDQGVQKLFSKSVDKIIISTISIAVATPFINSGVNKLISFYS